MLPNANHFIGSLVFFFFIALHHIGPSHLEYGSHKLYCMLINTVKTRN